MSKGNESDDIGRMRLIYILGLICVPICALAAWFIFDGWTFFIVLIAIFIAGEVFYNMGVEEEEKQKKINEDLIEG